ncbi:MAG: hypothetical protein Q9195_006469 [Heterodermia aff. obscurata]
MDVAMDSTTSETDLQSQTSVQQDSVLRSSSYPNIDYDERAFEPTNDGHRHEEYRGSIVEPFSSYRNSASMPHPIDDYPNEICQDLNCWQTAPHQHTIEELQNLMNKARSQVEHDPSENEEQVQKPREARKIAKKPTKLQSSRGSNRSVENTARFSRDLRSALPDKSELAAQTTDEQSDLAQLLLHRPSNGTFTLALRQKPSMQSRVETDEAGTAEPA